MPKRLRTALFGAGRIGQIHGRNISAHPDLDLVTVCDPFEDSAAALSTIIGGQPTTDAETAFSLGVDAVVIASPNSTHIDLLLQCARRGVAALCEKPIDLNMDRVVAAYDQLKSTSAPIMLGFNRRFDPNFAELRRRTSAGDIGRLEQLVITSRDLEPSPRQYVATSGGIFKDMTIHDFDMARSFVPHIVEVTAMGGNVFSDYTQELGDYDQAVVMLRGADDELITITNSRHSPYGYDQRLEAFGDAGMLQAANVAASTVRRSSPEGVDVGTPYPNFFDRYQQSYRLELAEFVSTVAEDRQPNPGYLDGMRALDLALAAAESARTGAAVTLDWESATPGPAGPAIPT